MNFDRSLANRPTGQASQAKLDPLKKVPFGQNSVGSDDGAGDGSPVGTGEGIDVGRSVGTHVGIGLGC